jgi:glycosyltransferase involved in cell wall biosynthesis
MKKILLVTDVPPSQKYTAGIALEQLCRNIPLDSLLIYTASSRYVDQSISPEFETVIRATDLKPREGYRNCDRRKLPLFLALFAYRFLKERWNAVCAKMLLKRILRFAEPHDIGIVWCVLQGQTMVRIAAPLADALNAKLYVQVWDSLNWWLLNHHVDPISRRWLNQLFDDTLKRADGCATASDHMNELYTQKYGTRCVPLVHSRLQSTVLPPDSNFACPDKVTIGFAGQLYAQDAFHALIHMLEFVKWEVAGKKIEIYMFGQNHEWYSKTYSNIKFLGWRGQDELIPSLRQFDVLYMPYTFDLKFKETMMTSFPSKLVAYLTAGRPVLYHGPDYSSVFSTLTKAKASAGMCTKLTRSAIYNALYAIITNEQKRFDAVVNGHKLVLEKFTIEVQSELFKQLFSMDMNGLDSSVPLENTKSHQHLDAAA